MNNIVFRGKRKDNGEIVEGESFLIWKRYNKKLPMIGEGVQNGSVYGHEIIPESLEIIHRGEIRQECRKCNHFPVCKDELKTKLEEYCSFYSNKYFKEK
jgi:hypothetical protein